MEELYKPAARVDRLVVQQVRGETLIYDLASHRAYCLNSTAALVWQECTGSATVGEIAVKLFGCLSAPELVWLAIDQLTAFDLLEDAPPRRRSRRRAIKSLAAAALIAVPAVSAIATPKDNRGSMSVCVCVGSSDCARPGCPSPPNCGPVGICV